MQATATDLVVMDRFFATRPVMTELRLTGWRPLSVLRPALMGSLRLGMGAGVGAGFGAMSGHYGLWVGAGMVLGAALNAICGQQSGAIRVEGAQAAEGPYRIH